jgi:hypothetical protein
MKIKILQQYSINKTNCIFFLTSIASLSLLVFLLNNPQQLHPQPALSYANNILKTTKVKLTQDQNNYKHLIGIIQNIGNKTVNHIIITANFIDSAHNSIGNFSKESEITTLNSKEITPFDILIFDKKIYDKINGYTIDIKYNITKHKDKKLVIVSNTSHLDINGFYFINGEIQNTGPAYSNNTTVTTITYNKNKELAGIWKAQTEPYTIPPLATASFSIPITDKIQSFQISDYTLLAESDKYTISK